MIYFAVRRFIFRINIKIYNNVDFFLSHQGLTGKPLKRFESLDGLTQQQITTRVEWFVEEMKRNDILHQRVNINCRSIALRNRDHVCTSNKYYTIKVHMVLKKAER